MKTKTMRCVVTDALFPPLSLSLSPCHKRVFIRRGVFSPPPPIHTTSQYLSLTATCELRHTL